MQRAELADALIGREKALGLSTGDLAGLWRSIGVRFPVPEIDPSVVASVEAAMRPVHQKYEALVREISDKLPTPMLPVTRLPNAVLYPPELVAVTEGISRTLPQNFRGISKPGADRL